MTQIKKLLATVVLAVVFVLGLLEQSVFAQGVSPFAKRGAGLEMTSADLTLVNKSRDELLAAKSGQPTRRWKNPETGASGVTTLAGTFTKQGLPCREIRYDIEVKGKSRRFIVPYCQVKNGSWKIAF